MKKSFFEEMRKMTMIVAFSNLRVVFIPRVALGQFSEVSVLL
jgi:hypothetical protein